MAKPHILFHRPTPWESDLQCSTKTYAQLFSDAGYPVTYMQANVNAGHTLLKKGYYHTYKLGSRFEGKVWVTGVMSPIPHLDNKGKLWAKLTGRNSYLSAKAKIKKEVLASNYGEPDIIWTTIPGSSALKEIFPKAKLFFHVVDMYSAYRGNGVQYLEQQDYQRADHLFVIGEALKNYLNNNFKVKLSRITNLGQGVHLNRYAKTPQQLAAADVLGDYPKPVALWLGLTRKLDQGMLSVISQEMAQKKGSLVLIGPSSDWLNEFLENHSNAHYLGSISSEQVPQYLLAAQIGIMTYDRSRQEIYAGQHPLKLYEYAAAGLPVISTNHEEYKTLEPPVKVVNNEAEVSQRIKDIFDNYEVQSLAMKNFAEKHSWENCKKSAEQVFKTMQLI